MKKHVLLFAVVTIVLFNVNDLGEVAQAQTDDKTVCMSKTPTAAPKLKVVLLESRKSELEGAGFAEEECGVSSGGFADYRSQICGLASQMSAGSQQQFAQSYGITPARLCDLANEI